MRRDEKQTHSNSPAWSDNDGCDTAFQGALMMECEKKVCQNKIISTEKVVTGTSVGL